MAIDALSITQPIARLADDVKAYLADPVNFAEWAAGMGSGLECRDGVWKAHDANGAVTIRFSGPNPFGIADHWVTLPDGSEAYIPLRTIDAGDSALVVFTLIRQPGMDDEAFAADEAAVRKDLEALRGVLEARAG